MPPLSFVLVLMYISPDMTKDFTRYTENAIRLAEGQMGVNNYIGLCLAFVEKAYEVSNSIEMFGGSTAKESANEYGTIIAPGLPPRGVFVFYDCSDGNGKNWGHVGLSTGDGKVIHAWDEVRLDGYLDIEKLPGPPGWTKPEYIGWVPVERLLQGYHKKVW
jgi:hypothetical protein